MSGRAGPVLRHAAVAGHPFVTGVMRDVFAAGGNAVDAGVAGCIASVVALPDQCNMGGIVPMTVLPAGSSAPLAISGVGTWSAAIDPEEMVTRFAGGLPPGAARAVVPAAVSAWTTALERFGTLRFADVAGSAIRLARDGLVVGPGLAASLERMGRTFARWPSSRTIYWPDGAPPRVGQRLVQHDLAALLARLAEAESRAGGDREAGLTAVRDEFYESDVAVRIAAFVVEHGGWMTPKDLSGFAVSTDATLSVQFRGLTVWVPPGYTQGPVLLELVRLLEVLGVGRPADDERSAHLLVEAVNAAFWDREEMCGDPSGGVHDIRTMLADERLQGVARLIGERASVPRGKPGVASTVAVCAVDSDGNVFSGTPSDTLDGGPVVDGLGIICSPRGAQSRGAHGHANQILPGRRPCATPSPAVIQDADGKTFALAAAGGDMIVQAMAQVLNEIGLGSAFDDALDAPRLGVFTFPDAFSPHRQEGVVRAELRLPRAVRDSLSRRGHHVRSWGAFDEDAAAVACAWVSTGTPEVHLGASADRRRGYDLVVG